MAGSSNDCRPHAILVAGPTGSGKSALAIRLAETHDGVILNADSMQVYRDLRLLSARPSEAEEGQVPHRLFGYVDGAEAWSVARWLGDVERELAACRAQARTAVVVGGTGLYFKALLEGLAPVPEIPEAVRCRWREAARTLAPGALHAELQRRDPAMAVRLGSGDLQRIARALEVVDGSGRSLADWQRATSPPLLAGYRLTRLRLALGREAVRARCDARLEAMVAAGVLDEVSALVARGLSWEQPVMRAIGVRPFATHLTGNSTLEEAVSAAKLETRQYVKRQETWLNRWMADWIRVEPG
jgi:tRNA dimethylallyltransferase